MKLNGTVIAVWGLSFKPKTDDIRDAPSISIISELQELGAAIHAYDPIAMENAGKVLKNIKFFENPYDAAKNCDAIIVATEWDEFRNVDMKAVKSLMKKHVIVDGRNIYDPEELKKLGFIYLGIGR